MDRSSPVVSPAPSRSLLSDLRQFVVRRPTAPTLVRFASPEARQEAGSRILQRLGVCVSQYGVLNVHRIGVAAPGRLIFEEFASGAVAEACWPNHLAALDRDGGGIEHVRVFLLDRRVTLFGLRSGFLGLDFIPLFQLDLLKRQDTAAPDAVDDGRFLLYSCSGGYPIGIFGVYVRSSLPGTDEEGESQVFILVSFNFFGKRTWPGLGLVQRVWEWVHNRVTSNVLNRLKNLCEARCRDVRGGRDSGGPIARS